LPAGEHQRAGVRVGHLGAVLTMRRFLLGSVLACLCGSAVAASAQLLNTHAGLGVLGGGSGGGAIAFNAAADLGNVNPGTSLTQAYTVGSGTNRLLIVNVIGDVLTGIDDCSGGSNGVTSNGTGMTLRQKNTTTGGSTDRFLYLFELLAPSSGSNNVVVTCGSSHFIAAEAADYSGVVADDAVGQASTGGSTTSLTIPITTGATSSWVVATIGSDYTLATSYQSTGGSSVAMTQRVIDSAFHFYGILDSAGTVSPGVQSVILQLDTGPTVDYIGIAASYHP
jgi:hypothetical protein